MEIEFMDLLAPKMSDVGNTCQIFRAGLMASMVRTVTAFSLG